jgi:glycosyltransferase involved in cell wall biosynthesis
VSSEQAELPPRPRIGSVVIGRNEGERLIRCLKSLTGSGPIVYVDSQSIDDSAETAATLGAVVVHLDMKSPFTAARARNAGFARLQTLLPDAVYVQFVDGDCQVVAGWKDLAVRFLDENPEVAAVCGRRMECFPDASIFNAMCNQEWNTPSGPAISCGGDSIMRTAAFNAVGGFSPTQIAHEEPELCGRLRKSGWKLWRLNTPMTLHDAAIFRFGQFYKRSRRAGFGIAQALFQSGWDIDPDGRAIVRRSLVWAVILPLVAILATFIYPTLAAAILAVYPLQILRHAVTNRQRVGNSMWYRLKAAAVAMGGKFAEAHGVIEYIALKITHKKLSPVYYK